MKSSYPITRVTPRAHALIKGVEGAMIRFESTDPKDIPARVAAWTTISVAREALYQYIASLEKRTVKINRQRTVKLRF